MPDYSRYGPFVNGSAPGISASFLNAIETVFVQPSGGTETGHYRVLGGSYATGAVLGTWITTLSRGATMLSATIDQADGVTTNLNPPTWANVNAGGFVVYATSTGVALNCYCAGNYTCQY